jgi:catechol 2,3-dioxygenase-like lactoylglutathione lyase family enzyme
MAAAHFSYARIRQVSMFGHHHLNVTSIEAHARFFVDTLGGTRVASTASPDAIVRFPNALIFLRERVPAGGTKGTTVNHFAFGVQNIRQMVDRTKAAGWPIVTRGETAPAQEVKDDLAYMVDQQTDVAFIMAPDDTKIEFIEIRQQASPIAVHHIHFLTPQVAEMKAWYVEVFGATPGKRGNFEAADMPGINLTYSPSPVPVVGTRGRALDHIGFEIKNLEGFCARLEGSGLRLERPYEMDTDLNVATAFLTDPWGTYIGLTEGLDGVC